MKMELRSRAIDKVFKRRDRIEMPDFQREEVWPLEKKRRLLDSILRGWHLPKFYFRKVENGVFECVDGQQRLAAIWEFYEGHLKLAEDSAKLFGGATYETLPDDISDALDDYEIDIEEIEDASDGDLEELFQRLQLGTPLNTAERLNAIGGDLKEFCQWVSKQPYFKDKIGLKDTRYSHFEIAVKWLFLESRGVQPQMRFPQLESLLKDNRTYSRQTDTAKRVTQALAYLDRALTSRAEFLRNRANTLTVCALASRVVAAGLDRSEKSFGAFLEHFFSSLAVEVEKGLRAKDRELLDYQQAISFGSTGGESIRARSSILTKRLATFDGAFAPLLGTETGARTAAERDLREKSDQIRDLIATVNRRYAGANGEDLFKPTNETAAAINRLGIPCRDSSSLGELVDNLYFLVYEGSGSCKRLPSPLPDFAMDVKFLRTLFRHDVDHGPAADVAKKRVRNTEVLRRYSGKQSVGDLGPDEILATHSNLMDHCIAFLVALP